MTTLEKIRAEIKSHFLWDGEDENNLNTAVRKCLEILDKYASEECDNDCEHCTWTECPKEPNDLIRRTDMLDAVGHGTTYTTEHLQKIINGLPSVNLCEDAVSRQAILDKLNEWEWQELYLPIHFKENIIDELPSVQPKGETE